MVYRWEKAYLKRGLSGLEDNRGRSKKYMTKVNKKSKTNTPIKENEREKLIRLREENKLLEKKIICEKTTSPATRRGSKSKEKIKIILNLQKNILKVK